MLLLSCFSTKRALLGAALSSDREIGRGSKGSCATATAEHWMMAQKAHLFGDSDAFDKIVKARTPGEAKAIGREVKNFDDSVWEEQRFEIVVNGSLQKFGQHQDLQEFLINTKDRILVEASPVDNIWGIGLSVDDKKAENPEHWEGLNLLGFALMETRDILNNNLKQLPPNHV
ncbi:NADAR family protein [Adhaeribacter arboris]|uniref:NADAR family protein n=1 Tax=Adhaeribacter arboris TaxID=2072846 RepID=UPI001E45114A|nr:NADAR family protein [Adhaeribacter arboris]